MKTIHDILKDYSNDYVLRNKWENMIKHRMQAWNKPGGSGAGGYYVPEYARLIQELAKDAYTLHLVESGPAHYDA